MELNIHFQIFGTLMLFVMFWLLFYQLNYQESIIRRILLIICMALYRPLLSIFVHHPFFQLPVFFRVLFPFAMVVVIALLTGGKKRSVWITAAYFLGATIFIDTIATAVVLGLTGSLTSVGSLTSIGSLGFSSKDLYFYGGISIYFVLFLTVIIYYLIMRAVPQEALDRIPLYIWLIILLFLPTVAAGFYIPMDSLLIQMEGGHNILLLLGSFLCILFILNLVIFYFLINLVSGYSARLLAGELNNTPPVYSPQSGLSPEFIEKYGLTSREAEITVTLLRGKSNKEIAALLYIDINTVQTHLNHIYRKTGAPGRYALMSLAGMGK
jgi:DNA-binding CsgD family transcriptional regulator